MTNNREIDLPSEVLEIIGMENLFLNNPVLHNVMLESLQKLYQTKGLEYIKEHRDSLIKDSKVLEMF
jgi:hypothetical protein